MEHLKGCPADRVESYPLDGSVYRYQVTRCCDCGESVAEQLGPIPKVKEVAKAEMVKAGKA